MFEAADSFTAGTNAGYIVLYLFNECATYFSKVPRVAASGIAPRLPGPLLLTYIRTPSIPLSVFELSTFLPISSFFDACSRSSLRAQLRIPLHFSRRAWLRLHLPY